MGGDLFDDFDDLLGDVDFGDLLGDLLASVDVDDLLGGVFDDLLRTVDEIDWPDLDDVLRRVGGA